MSTRLRMVLIAVALGVVATVAVAAYVFSLQSRVKHENTVVTALVAGRNLAAGTSANRLLAEGLFERQRVPRKYLPTDYLTTMGPVKGKITASAISKGDVLSRSRFISRRAKATSGIIPKGKLGVGFVITDASSVSALAQPGTKVSVLASMTPGPEGKDFTKIIISNAPVIRYVPPPPSQRTTGKGTIVLALTPSDAERAVYGAKNGELWMALQRDGRNYKIKTKGVTMDNLYK